MADIKQKPTGKVSSLGAPARKSGGSHTMTAKWSTPSSLTSSSSEKRATKARVRWLFEMYDRVSLGKNIEAVNVLVLAELDKAAMSISSKSSSVNLNSFKAKISSTGKTKTFTRESFYPVTKRKLKSVSVAVYAMNDHGEGPAATATRKFEAPKKPTVTALTQNENTGVVSCTITPADGTGYREIYDTRYVVTIQDTRTGKTTTVDETFKGSKFTYSYDVKDRDQLTDTQYVKITLKAQSRGYAGASGWATTSTVVGSAALPTITDVQVPSTDPTARVTVLLKTNATGTHPVDGIRIQKLVSVSYDEASDIPGNEAWEDAGSQDNGKCTALALRVADLIPARGKRTWIRLKAWNDFESRPAFVRYSAPCRVKKLETPAPTAEDDEVVMISLEPRSDGASAVATLGWNEDGKDDSTSTELSWSDAEDAWRSTDPPETYDFSWSDGPLTHGGKTYNDSAKVTIKGLDEGVPVYARARRHMEKDDVNEYGKYSDTLTALPVTSPASVVLAAPEYIASGSAASFTWTYDSTAMQRTWRLMHQSGASQASGDEVIDQGTDPVGSCRIEWDRLEDLMDESGIIRAYIAMSTGGAEVVSETVNVLVVEPPTIEIVEPGTLTAQPLTVGVRCNDPSASVTVIVTSQNANGDWPDGERVQAEGDTIWSDVVSPVWTQVGTSDVYAATITAPDNLDFWHLGEYEITARATNMDNGLASEDSEASFGVEWAHTAPAPSSSITVTPSDAYDSEGRRVISAAIKLMPPPGAAAGDSYDIYRVTNDGPSLIGKGAALDATIIDEFAPFGEAGLAYRVATTTSDGHVDWADYPYTLESKHLRIDWDGKYLELRWNLAIDDSYAKDVDVRAHLDGTTSAYWNKAVERKGSLSAVLVRVESAAEIALLGELAEYPGPAFLRLPTGSAFEADVQVSGLNTSSDTSLSTVRLDVTQIDLTKSFMATLPVEEDDGEEEG